MKIENIDEAEALIRKFRKVMAAKEKINVINGEDGGDTNTFVLTDKDTGTVICLHELKIDVLGSIDGVLNEQYDKIVARLREI